MRYEYHCQRGPLFSEKYLAYPIGQILNAEYGARVAAEVDHPVLSREMVGPGRRPQVDFVIRNAAGDIEVAVESKWCGRTVPKLENITWDIVRLELLAHDSGAETFFVLGGQKRVLARLFESDAFLAPNANREPRPLLRYDDRRAMGMRLDTPPAQRVPGVRKLFRKYPDVPMPNGIVTGKPYRSPTDGPGSQYQVFAWKVASRQGRRTFLPREHRLYR